MTDWDDHIPVENQYNLDDFHEDDPHPSGIDTSTTSDGGANEPLPSVPETDYDFLVDPRKTPSNMMLSIGYARVSTAHQEKHGENLDRQEDVLTEAIESDDDAVKLTEIIRDGGESGLNLNRSGLKAMFQLASDGLVDRIYVTKIDRIGRKAPETLYLIYKLQEDMNVEVRVQNESIDISDSITDLVQTTMEALMAEFSVEQRVTASIKSQINQFENGNWYIFNNSAPLGYQPTDPSGVDVASESGSKASWIEVDESEKEVAEYLFDQFVKTESYTETAKRVCRKYEDAGVDITRYQVKQAIQRDVYIGEPSHELDTERLDAATAEVSDSSLQLIDEETHERAQEIVRANQRRYSSSSNRDSPTDFLKLVGLEDVQKEFPNVELACPDCGEKELSHNGRRQAGEYDAFNMLCQNCGRQFKWPKNDQTKYFDDDRRGGT